MFILKGSLIIITLLFISLQIGLLVKPKITEKNVFDVLPYGFLSVFAIYQLLFLPMKFIFNHKMLFYAFFCIIILILCIITFFLRKNQFKTYILLLKEYFTLKNLIFTLGFIGIVIFQIYMRCTHMRVDTDDTLYVAWSEMSANSLDFVTVNPTFNIPEINITYLYMFNSWEIFLGMLCSFTGINAASLVHSIIPVFVIIISYSAILALATRFFKKSHEIILFAIGVAFFNFFGKFSGYSTGFFILIRSWFGKTLVATLGIPMITCYMLDFFEKGKGKKIFAAFKLCVVGFANIGFNPTAIFLLPMLCVLLFLAYLFMKTKKLILRIIFIALPIIIATVTLTYINTSPKGVIFNIPNQELYNFNETYTKYLYNGIYFIGAIIIGILSTIKARKNQLNSNAAVVLFYLPLLLILYVCNPSFSHIIAHYITTKATFWRILWLFPYAYAFAYLIAKTTSFKLNFVFKSIIIAGIAVIIAIGGVNVYTYTFAFQQTNNTEKLPKDLVELNKVLQKDIENKEYKEKLKYSKMNKEERAEYNELKKLKIKEQKKNNIPVINTSTKLIGNYQAYSYLPQLSSKINILISQKNYDPYFANYNEEYIRCAQALRTYATNPLSLSGTTKFKYCVYKTDVDYFVTNTSNYKCQRILKNCNVEPLYANESFILYDLTGLKAQFEKNPPQYKFAERNEETP